MKDNSINIDNTFDNIINNRAIKEQLGNAALALLVSHKFISMEKDLNHLVVEFGYLLMPKDSDDVNTLMKITTPKESVNNFV